MTILQIVLTIITAILIGVLFYSIFKVSGPWGKIWSFILILILAGLAAQAWVPPIGPVYWEVAWIPTLFVLLLFALMLAAASPPRRLNREVNEEVPLDTPYDGGKAAAVLLGAFFWVFILFLAIAAIAGFIYVL